MDVVILKFIRNMSSDSLEIKETVQGTSPTSCFNPVIVSLTSLVDPFHSCFVVACKKSTMKNDKMLTQSKFKTKWSLSGKNMKKYFLVYSSSCL